MQKVVERFVLKLFHCGIDGVFIAHLLVYRILSVTHGGGYPAARRRGSVLYLGWSPSLLLILAYGRGSFQRRINDPPSLLDVVLPGEQGRISRHRVAQHPFIGIHIVWGRRSASRNFRGNAHRLIARNREVQTESNRIVGADSEPEIVRLQVNAREYRGWTSQSHQHFGMGTSPPTDDNISFGGE